VRASELMHSRDWWWRARARVVVEVLFHACPVIQRGARLRGHPIPHTRAVRSVTLVIVLVCLCMCVCVCALSVSCLPFTVAHRSPLSASSPVTHPTAIQHAPSCTRFHHLVAHGGSLGPHECSISGAISWPPHFALTSPHPPTHPPTLTTNAPHRLAAHSGWTCSSRPRFWSLGQVDLDASS
jgi:hypothetical protein